MFDATIDPSLIGYSKSSSDVASKTLGDALDFGSLSGIQTFNDSVGSVTPINYYQFSLATVSDFSLSLDGLTADADVALIQDTNLNGVVDGGEVLDFSTGWGTTSETININELAAGDYFIAVEQFSGDTSYNLNLSMTADVAEWTYMVYLDADNDLESFGIEDFMEMAEVGSTDDVNIVVQMDRTTDLHSTLGYSNSYGDWTDTRRGLVEAGDLPDQSWGTSIGEVNMGDQNTLSDFINWGTSNYFAENYAMILWNHGNGWNSIASDDSSGGDSLTANEVSGALAGCSGIDLVGADACFMGMVEFADQISKYASVFVGSEQFEDGQGWSYDTILADLTTNPTWDAAQLGTAIVDRYAESFTGSNDTLSAIDLSAISSLSTTIDQLATTIMSDATSYDFLQLQNHRHNAAGYGTGQQNYRDLGTFLFNIANDVTMTSSIRLAAEEALATYESAIIHNHSGPNQGATGLSIYFQPANTSADPQYNSLNSTFAANTAWDEFLNWWG